MNSLFQRYDAIFFLDTETSGLNFQNDRIIELAAIRCTAENNITITHEMDDFVRLPQGWVLPEEITNLTGITDEMLKNEGIDATVCAQKFASLLAMGKKNLLIAYNAQFDMNYLFYFLHRAGVSGSLKGIEMLDALTVYKDRHEYPHKLENAIETYKLAGKVQNSHRAIDDTKALLEVMLAMGEEKRDLARYINLFGYNPKYGISGKKISSVCYKPQYYRHSKYLYED